MVKRLVLTLSALLPGSLLLSSFFLPAGDARFAGLRALNAALLNAAILLACLLSLAAIVGLAYRQLRRIPSKRMSATGFTATIGFVLTVLLGFSQRNSASLADLYQRFVLGISVPLESALMGLLAITLIYAAMRLLRKQRTPMAWAFIAALLLSLAWNNGWLEGLRAFALGRAVLALLPALPSAGARGLLIGIALAGLIAGLRVLTGQQRPSEGESA